MILTQLLNVFRIISQITAVLNSEIIKLITCLYVVYRDHGDISSWATTLKTTIFDQPIDTLKVCVPSLVYVVQVSVQSLTV